MVSNSNSAKSSSRFLASEPHGWNPYNILWLWWTQNQIWNFHFQIDNRQFENEISLLSVSDDKSHFPTPFVSRHLSVVLVQISLYGCHKLYFLSEARAVVTKKLLSKVLAVVQILGSLTTERPWLWDLNYLLNTRIYECFKYQFSK